VWQIAGMVGIDADSVVGKLLKVWRWFDAHTETGNALGVSYPLVDHVAGVSGFAEAMALCGWLRQDGSTLTLPNFDRHNGKTAKNRALTAKRVAQSKEKSNAKGNAPIVTTALPREEKRREEEKQKKPAQARTPQCDLKTFLSECEARGEDPIPADDAVFDYAKTVGLPHEFVALAWWAFKRKWANKRQAGIRGWRQTFRNAVEGNWGGLWRADGDGWVLTTAGIQAQRASR
jgi:hypothetical protein